ncbi:hypothetical protein DdX_17399 [Ditylenchus destructor]|uniref:Carboxypeptidase regulatory-like domain-containing protein n=1 Tax=Ditylenchus destructor TaxID=166010 RepID=A0AAD4MLS3_9BILA|nr:hypothetical protein DdX_17399 [Ditylenchus destructor]
MQYYLLSNPFIFVILIFMPVANGAGDEIRSEYYYNAFLENYTLTGTVYSQKTNKPAAGAVLDLGYYATMDSRDGRVTWNTVRRAPVNSDGSFKMENVKLRPTAGEGYIIRITYNGIDYEKPISPGSRNHIVDIENYHIPDLSTKDKVVHAASMVASKTKEMLRGAKAKDESNQRK